MGLRGIDFQKMEKWPGGHTLVTRRKELIRQLKDDEALLEKAISRMDPETNTIIQRLGNARAELNFVGRQILELWGVYKDERSNGI